MACMFRVSGFKCFGNARLALRARFTVRPFDKLSALRNIDGQAHGPECYRRANNEL